MRLMVSREGEKMREKKTKMKTRNRIRPQNEKDRMASQGILQNENSLDKVKCD